MDSNKFLEQLLDDHEVKPESKEAIALEFERAKVEQILNKKFADAKVTIEAAGSKAKGTMILESYDLDLPAYYANDERPNESLEEIFNSFELCLKEHYSVERKRSALRLKKKGELAEHEDFHIDVVPGRYTDRSKTDSFLYVNDTTDKERLKTNLQTHVSHIKNSGVVDEIRLLKLWKIRNHIEVKTFILELLTVKFLKEGSCREGLSLNLKYVWKKIRDEVDDINLEDPANPTGNDLSKVFTAAMSADLKSAAKSALRKVESESGWHEVFGERIGATSAGKAYIAPSTIRLKPWCES